MTWEGWSNFERITVDNDRAVFEVVQRSGEISVMAQPPSLEDAIGLDLPADFRRVDFLPESHHLRLVTARGDAVELEVSDGETIEPPRRGRPAIYLDQNKWIQLARALHSPDRVTTGELGPSLRLIELAEQQRVLLPLSGGHLLETTVTDRRWREQLSILMMRLSRGWVLRDPTRVARTELLDVFLRHAGRPAWPMPVAVTLELREVTTEDLRGSPVSSDGDLIPPLALVAEMLSTVTALFAVLLDGEALSSPEGQARTAAWADAHQRAADVLRADSRIRRESRTFTRALFLRDLQHDIVEAQVRSGLSLSGFNDWLEQHSETDIADMPYLGRRRDLVHRRLMNANDRWEPNDLVDTMFLPLAAAYADFVVAERKTEHYLRSVQRRVVGGASVVCTISDLVEELEPVLSGAKA